MTVAYLVLSHRNPEQVLRLVSALMEGSGAEVVVRHDQAQSRLEPGPIEQLGARLMHDTIDFRWGGITQLELLLTGLGHVAGELDPDWLLVLSGQDYPLRPLEDIHGALAESGLDAMLGGAWELDTRRLPPPPEDEFFLRYAYAHFPAPDRLRRLPGALRPLTYLREPPAPRQLGVRRPRLPYGPGRRCYVSSDWLTLSRPAVRAVLDAARSDRRLMRHYRRVAIPSESFFATVLLNDPNLKVARTNRRYIRFPGPGHPHPDTLTSADLDELLDSGCDFARKFDAQVDSAVLDALDARRRAGRPR